MLIVAICCNCFHRPPTPHPQSCLGESPRSAGIWADTEKRRVWYFSEFKKVIQPPFRPSTNESIQHILSHEHNCLWLYWHSTIFFVTLSFTQTVVPIRCTSELIFWVWARRNHPFLINALSYIYEIIIQTSSVTNSWLQTWSCDSISINYTDGWVIAYWWLISTGCVNTDFFHMALSVYRKTRQNVMMFPCWVFLHWTVCILTSGWSPSSSCSDPCEAFIAPVLSQLQSIRRD